jgi:hypothetical protein
LKNFIVKIFFEEKSLPAFEISLGADNHKVATAALNDFAKVLEDREEHAAAQTLYARAKIIAHAFSAKENISPHQSPKIQRRKWLVVENVFEDLVQDCKESDEVCPKNSLCFFFFRC